MIRARTSYGRFILGIDAENVKRLKDGQPIVVSLCEMGGHDDVMIVYGETLDDIKRDLERECGPLPEPTVVGRLRH